MYVPSHFANDDDAAWQIVRDAGAGMLVIAGTQGLASVFAPVVISEDRSTVRSHIARANPWWRQVPPEGEVLAMFVAASAYVSPTYYPSRDRQPATVPTWNYEMAEVRGRVIVHEESEWTDSQVRALTDRFEDGRDPRWWVEDAPAPYVARQLKAIVGLEIIVGSIEGKSKLSQNRLAEDREGVREHLAAGTLGERNVADRMTQ